MLLDILKNTLLVFVEKDLEKKYRLATWGWIFLIYLTGLLLWGMLFDWRQTSLNFHDWSQINLPRMQVIKDAIQTTTFPLHVADAAPLHNLTDRFLALPDVITTPQMLLLLFVDVDTFALLDLVIQYTIATAGLIYFRKKYSLSLVTYAIIFFMFNFNGYIQAHYVVGHITWAGYFLFPWFFILAFEFTEKRPSWYWVAKVAFLSFYIILCGSQHHFLWMMLFLSFLGLASWDKIRWIFAAILASGFLSAIRLLPPVLIIGTVEQRVAFQSQAGYIGVTDWLLALIHIRQPDTYRPGLPFPLGYWEFDYFVGIAGAIFLLLFGLLFWIRDQQHNKRFVKLFLPFFVTFLLSIGFLYGDSLYHLPIFGSERVISRMVSIPTTLLILIAAIYFDEWLRMSSTAKWIAVAGFILLLNDLTIHARLWNVHQVAEQFTKVQIQFGQSLLGNHPDPLYINLLLLASASTIIVAVTLLFLAYRSSKKQT
jgi:hypothetical protein